MFSPQYNYTICPVHRCIPNQGLEKDFFKIWNCLVRIFNSAPAARSFEASKIRLYIYSHSRIFAELWRFDLVLPFEWFTIMSSIAQEESRKISERIKWGMKKRMEDGVVLGCGRIYGYKVVDGNLEIVPEEAEIVKQIFHSYLYDGKGSSAIAHDLEEQGIPTLKNRVWSPQHVLKILNNEKYVGDLTQWKVYKPNILAEKTKINRGDNPEAPLITVRNHHKGIISREVWDAV